MRRGTICVEIWRVSSFESPAAYEDFMGRYSRQLAVLFADFAGVTATASVLDVGAGTGALTAELVRRNARASAADPSASFVSSLAETVPGAEVRVAPAESLPWADEHFDAALAQLVVTFMSDAPAGVQEMRRVVRAGGTVAVCMWDREGMDMLAAVERAQTALASGGQALESLTRYRSRPELESLFDVGFTDLGTELLEVRCTYENFDELWKALRGGAGPVGAWAAGLAANDVDAARAEVHRQLGEPRGSFALAGRAWATKARRAS